MRLVLSLLILLMASAPAQAWEVKYPEAKIYAVEVWARWCPGCKILSPKVEEAIEKGEFLSKDVLFIRLDFTDKPMIHQSKLWGIALGLDEFMKANGSGTGYMALIDAETKEEVARFDAESSVQDIIDGINVQLDDTASE